MTDNDDWSLLHDARRPIPEAISDRLIEFIESGRFPRGEPLPNESELARKFHVSRSSVRTALQSLKHRGLVTVSRGVGWSTTAEAAPVRPAQLDRDQAYELAQLFEVRIALEQTASGLAARRADDRQIVQLARAFEAHRDTDPHDVDALITTDEAFHDAVLACAQNTVLQRMYEMLVPEVRQFRVASFARGGAQSAQQSSFGHGLVLQYVRNHDSAGAKQAMASHLLTFSAQLGQAYPEEPHWRD